MTETVLIPPTGSLDSITVFWQNFGIGKGQITLVCWGSAWTAYFGGMGDDTIQQFFTQAGSYYLAGKLMSAQWQTHTKTHEKYIVRLCDAVKAHMKQALEAV
jgi:hypothetical protein